MHIKSSVISLNLKNVKTCLRKSKLIQKKYQDHFIYYYSLKLTFAYFREKRSSKGFQNSKIKIEDNDVNKNLADKFNSVDKVAYSDSLSTPNMGIPSRKFASSASGSRPRPNHQLDSYSLAQNNDFSGIYNPDQQLKTLDNEDYNSFANK